MEREFLILQGIPGSGKTTWAKEFLKTNSEHWVRWNRDEIRNMLGAYWVPKREGFITRLSYEFLALSVKEGKNIIWDNTNLNEKDLSILFAIIREEQDDETNYEIKFKLFKTPLEECIERDSKRPNPVGEEVIRGFYNKYKSLYHL